MRGLNKLYLPSAGASNQCGALTATQGHTQFGFDHVWGLTIFVAVAVIAAVLLSCCLSYRPTLRKELSHLKPKELRKRAIAAGADHDEVEDADKAALMDIICEHEARQSCATKSCSDMECCKGRDSPAEDEPEASPAELTRNVSDVTSRAGTRAEEMHAMVAELLKIALKKQVGAHFCPSSVLPCRED